MRRSPGGFWVLVLLSLAAAACGSSGGTPDAATGGAGGTGKGGQGGQGGQAGAASQGRGGSAAGGNAGSSGSGGAVSAGGTGGSVSTGGAGGGAGGSGGSLLTGGGGGSGSGGSVSTGGTGGGGGSGTGGSVSTGGAGGTGGGSGTGGSVSTGGAGGTGGGSGTGGSVSTGGAGGGGTGGGGGSGTGGSVSTGGVGGTGGGAGSSGSGGSSAAGNCGAAQTLVDSADTLVDLFVIDAGVIVVNASTVSLVGRDGTVTKSVPFARQIAAAAFDGTTLVIADAAKLTVMSPALDVGPSAFLIATCGDAILVGGNLFVCGPNTDVSRVFDTYDVSMNPPAHIAASTPYTYNGVPMTRVPGTNAFVTVTQFISPPSFALYRVAAATGVTTFAGSSPFSAFAATPVLAFDGTPATHMVQSQGYLLGITGSACTGGIYGCFTQTGVVGTLRTGQSYIGLGDDGAGRLVAVVSSSTDALTYGAPCASGTSGCPLQLIDIPTRTILQQQTYTRADLRTVVRAAYDPKCGTAVLGYAKATMNSYVGTTGYRVEALAF